MAEDTSEIDKLFTMEALTGDTDDTSEIDKLFTMEALTEDTDDTADGRTFSERARDAGGQIGDIAQGVGAGFTNIAQGLSEVAVMPLESAGLVDEGSQEKVTQFFEDTKDTLGFTPDTTAGKVTETIATYVPTPLVMLSFVSKVAKAAKALQAGTLIPQATSLFGRSAQLFGRTAPKALTTTRVGQAALTTVGSGVGDFLVSPSTMGTLADSWDALPEGLRTEDEEGLTGSALQDVRLRNKVRLGVEGAAFNAAGEVLIPFAGGLIRSAASVPGVPLLARSISAGFDMLGNTINRRAASGGKVSTFLKKNFTPDGLTPPQIATGIRTAESMGEAQSEMASKAVAKYDKALLKVTKLQRLTFRGSAAIEAAHNKTMSYLTGNLPRADFKAEYGENVVKAADEMRDQIDTLSKEFEFSIDAAPNLTPVQKSDLKAQFSSNQGSYITRVYELYQNPEKFVGLDYRTLDGYDAAKNQLTGIIARGNPANQVAGAAEQEAVKMIDDLFKNDSIRQGMTTEAVKRNQLKGLATGVRDANNRTSLFKLATGQLLPRATSGRLEQATLLRGLMGEVVKPKDAFLVTINNMSTTMASQRLYDDVIKMGQSTARDAQGNLINPGQVKSFDEFVSESGVNPDARPFVVDGSTVLTTSQANTMKQNQYVQMGEVDLKNPFGGQYGSLSGNYVPTEIYASLTAASRPQGAMAGALAVALQAKGLSQMTKTVLNPLSTVRNFLSNIFVIGANGLGGRNMNILDAGDTLVANAVSNPAQFKFLSAMQNEGATGQNIQINEMRKLLEEQTQRGVSATLNKVGTFIRDEVPLVGKTIRVMEKAYQLGDDYFKVVAGLGEKARYGAALKKAGFNIDELGPEDLTRFLDPAGRVADPAGLAAAVARNDQKDAVKAALVESRIASRQTSIAGTDFGDMMVVDIVKATMPTYSMVPEAVKSLRKIPVMGNFISYPVEIMRTSANILERGVRELGFQPTQKLIDAMGDVGAKKFAREIRAIGAQRVSGYVSSALVAPYAIKAAAHRSLGITSEQEKLLDETKAPYAAGNNLMYITKPDEDLNAEAVDLSYMLPYDYILAPARAAMEIYQRKGSLGASDTETILAMSASVLQKFLEPFASEGLAAERVIDVTTRNGKTSTGAEIWEPGALQGEKVKKGVNHVLAAFLPGIAEQAITVKGGEVVQGRTTRAATGLPTKSGDKYTIAEEIGSLMTGLRPIKINTGRNLGFSGGAYSADRSSAVQIFTGKADDNDATVGDITDAYIRANEAKRRHQAKLKIRIDAAMDGGMTRRQVQKALENTGVSSKEFRNIMRNRYDPIKISRALIREVRDEVNVKKENRLLSRIPKVEINKIRSSLRNSEIIPTSSDDTSEIDNLFTIEALTGNDDLSLSAPSQPQVQVQPATQPDQSFFDQTMDTIGSTAGKVSDTISGITDSAGNIATDFLGSDPVSQLKNSQIAQSLRSNRP